MADQNELVFLALGGAGEIGMNCYMYGYGPARERRWIIVDLGIGFGDMETSPGCRTRPARHRVRYCPARSGSRRSS